jgi:hypothetical protein
MINPSWHINAFSALSQFAVSGTQQFLRRKNKTSLESGDKRFGGELPSS